MGTLRYKLLRRFEWIEYRDVAVYYPTVLLSQKKPDYQSVASSLSK